MCVIFRVVYKGWPQNFRCLHQKRKEGSILNDVFGPQDAPKYPIFLIVGKKCIFLPPWFFVFELEGMFFIPRFRCFWCWDSFSSRASSPTPKRPNSVHPGGPKKVCTTVHTSSVDFRPACGKPFKFLWALPLFSAHGFTSARVKGSAIS